MNKLLLFFNLLLVSLLPGIVKATIIIDSVKTTASSCANNGGITIYAQTTTGILLYTITGGPVTYPVQTSNSFSSLPPGNYTIEVSNTNNEIRVTGVEISGSYQLPDFLPIAINPLCPNASNGSIIGNASLTAGAAPYTWELIAPSTETRPAQANDTFYNLPQGPYTIRMMDACNNVQTKSVVLFTAAIPMTYQGAGYVKVTGCDTAEVYLGIFTSVLSKPYKLTYTIGGVVYTVDTAKINDEANFNGVAYIRFTVPGMAYGGLITDVTVTNNCGTPVYIPQLKICPFMFNLQNYAPVSIANCQLGALTTFGIGDATCNMGVYPKFPLTVTIRDIPANNIIEIKTYHNPFDFNFASVAMLPGLSYNITMEDSCNNTYSNTATIPAVTKYISSSVNSQQTMLDSTAILYLYAHGFPTQQTTLTILDGPVSAHSSKHGYAYSENYVYPKTFTGSLNSDSSIVFSMWNAAPGKYHYAITDSCGNQYIDSIEITTNDVASFYYRYNYKKGCVSESAVQYELLHNTFSALTVTDIDAATVVETVYSWQMNGNPANGVVNNIRSANYEMAIAYYGTTIANSMNNILVDVFTVKDTIHVTPYQNPALQTSAANLCNGKLFLILTADSSKGIAPYRYEIISGPQTFPPQASNLFELTQSGNYTIRLTDSCGNSISASVTVNPSVFPPLAALGNFCINGSAELTYGASTYFTYSWQRPNGSTYNGDTLFINPVTAADTGVYTIKRVATINGCSNTETSTYHLVLGKQDSTTATICHGQTFLFGGRLLGLAGVYRDTFATTSCDSVSILNLIVSEQKRDSSTAAICQGQTYPFGNSLLSVAGIYRDTIATAFCDSIAVLNLMVNEQKRDSSAAFICRGQTYAFGNRLLNVAGIYRDTIATAFCDSIAVLTLSVYDLPAVQVSSDKYMVSPGETVHLSANPADLVSYLWVSLNMLNTANIYNPSSIVNLPSWYKVTVTDANNCSRSDSLFISFRVDSVFSCDKSIISIPSAFTPNNDNRNDQFKIFGINNTDYKKYHLMIYNRWGQLVFESEKPTQAWDGTYKGMPAKIGNYVYHFEFICGDGQKAFIKKGNIVLLR